MADEVNDMGAARDLEPLAIASPRPVRVQRSRAKGWRMPENTVYVGRPTKWANPWRIGDVVDAPFVWHIAAAANAVVNGTVKITREIAADLYDESVVRDSRGWWFYLVGTKARYLAVEPLRGKNLACWCPLDQPCHVDTLLRVANEVVVGRPNPLAEIPSPL